MKKLALPITVSLLLLVVYQLLKYFYPGMSEQSWTRYVLAAALAGLTVMFVRAISYVIFDVAFVRRKGREAPDLLRGVLSLALYSVAFFFIYSRVIEGGLGLGIVATSTVVSVVIGLALQDTLGNFFAGISIHIEQPFHILDSIRIGTEIGRVEAVTWRTTTIRTNNNTVIVFPNSRVAREQVEIYPFNNLNRRVLRFPAPYAIAPGTIIPMVRETVRALPNVAPEKTPVVRIAEFADSSITYEILYWVRDYMLTPDMDARIREHIWYAFHRRGIEIPFPIRHLLMEQVESKSQALDDATDNDERFIESVTLFEPLTEEERARIAGSLIKRLYAPGELILRRGDAGDSMFIISQGRVDVRLPQANGSMQQVAVLEPGNYFGEMALFTGEPRTADVYALEEVEVLEIRKSAIEPLMHDNAQLAEAISRRVAERQAQLVAHTRAVPEEEKQQQSANILRRIKRFFSLG
ncbi:MAG TPA: mechanosensitive ion channel family protein [Blastocatellia bacterium]|nr:mechanosensitive ion channel family protein [Blastocatellia bacterium]